VSPRRRRDYAAEYRPRAERARARGSSFFRERVARGEAEGLSRAQAAGHARKAGERSPGRFFAERRWTVTIGLEPGELATVRVPRGEAQRAGRWNALVEALRDGRVSPREFRARVRRWAPVARRRVVSDPAVALALTLTAAPDAWIFESARIRARRGRRS